MKRVDIAILLFLFHKIGFCYLIPAYFVKRTFEYPSKLHLLLSYYALLALVTSYYFTILNILVSLLAYVVMNVKTIITGIQSAYGLLRVWNIKLKLEDTNSMESQLIDQITDSVKQCSKQITQIHNYKYIILNSDAVIHLQIIYDIVTQYLDLALITIDKKCIRVIFMYLLRKCNLESYINTFKDNYTQSIASNLFDQMKNDKHNCQPNKIVLNLNEPVIADIDDILPIQANINKETDSDSNILDFNNKQNVNLNDDNINLDVDINPYSDIDYDVKFNNIIDDQLNVNDIVDNVPRTESESTINVIIKEKSVLENDEQDKLLNECLSNIIF